MSRSEGNLRAIDWRAWLALAWAAWFAVLYIRMVLDERAPGVLRSIERAVRAVQNMV